MNLPASYHLIAGLILIGLIACLGGEDCNIRDGLQTFGIVVDDVDNAINHREKSINKQTDFQAFFLFFIHGAHLMIT